MQKSTNEIMREYKERREELIWQALLAQTTAGKYGEAALSQAIQVTDMFLKWKWEERKG